MYIIGADNLVDYNLYKEYLQYVHCSSVMYGED